MAQALRETEPASRHSSDLGDHRLPGGHVVAYASLAVTAIDRSAAPDALAKQTSDPIPALLLGRLAVDRRRAGAGIGTVLVAHVLATAVELDAKAACRAVVVSERCEAGYDGVMLTPVDGVHQLVGSPPNTINVYLVGEADAEAIATSLATVDG